MKTIREVFDEFLTKHNAYGNFYRELRSYQCSVSSDTDYVAYYFEKTEPLYFIVDAFQWSATIHKLPYWYDLNEAWESKLKSIDDATGKYLSELDGYIPNSNLEKQEQQILLEHITNQITPEPKLNVEPPRLTSITKTPTKCPICGGNGIVSGGFYSGVGEYRISSMVVETCKNCSGTGIAYIIEEKYK